MVRSFLNDGVDVDAKDRIGHTALMMAAIKGHADTVKTLLENYADVNVKGTLSGMTALMWAVKNGYPDIVKILLDKGADVKAKNRGGISALNIAGILNNTTIIKLLKQHGE
jgi:ankyrin repeat protein